MSAIDSAFESVRWESKQIWGVELRIRKRQLHFHASLLELPICVSPMCSVRLETDDRLVPIEFSSSKKDPGISC